MFFRNLWFWWTNTQRNNIFIFYLQTTNIQTTNCVFARENILTYVSALENSTWLSVGEKGKLISKLNKLIMIGNSTEILKDDKFIDANYQDVCIADTKIQSVWLIINFNRFQINLIDCFITNTLKLQAHKRIRMYQTNGKSALDKNALWTYLSSPIQTKPKIMDDVNVIALPFRFISKYTDPDEQKYELYGHLSYPIAYEIAKFLSPRNSKAIMTRDNDVWSTFVTISLSDPQIARTENIYELAMHKEDLSLTMDSRFSDDSALRIASESYKGIRSADDLPLPWVGDGDRSKLFYLSFGQQFCRVEQRHARLAIKVYESDVLENYFRLNSMIMNSGGFAEAFECPVGSKMNPELKTDQFPFLETDVGLDYAHLPDITSKWTERYCVRKFIFLKIFIYL